MSLINLRPIECSDPYLDCCAIFKQMVRIDSLGNYWINGLYGLAGNDSGQFTEADLQSVVLSDGNPHDVYLLTHNLDTEYNFGLVVKTETGNQITVGTEVIDANSLYIIIDSLEPHTYYYYIFK